MSPKKSSGFRGAVFLRGLSIGPYFPFLRRGPHIGCAVLAWRPRAPQPENNICVRDCWVLLCSVVVTFWLVVSLVWLAIIGVCGSCDVLQYMIFKHCFRVSLPTLAQAGGGGSLFCRQVCLWPICLFGTVHGEGQGDKTIQRIGVGWLYICLV